MQVMHVLYKSILSTSKMAEGAKQECTLVEKNCILFYVIIILREENQRPFERYKRQTKKTAKRKMSGVIQNISN